jgi:PAS domain S-box-containing protein
MVSSPGSKNDHEQRYETIFDSDMVGILASDLNGHIIEANDYFLRMVGYTREELLSGKISWVSLTAPEFLPASYSAGKNLESLEKVTPFEKDYIHKDGHRVPALVCLARYKDGSVIGMILDISDRKKTEHALEDMNAMLEEHVRQRTEALQRSEAFLTAVFEHIPNMVFVKDAKNLCFVRFNKAGEDLLGIPRSELLGKSDFDFFPAEQAQYFIEADRRVLSRERVVDIPEEPIQTRKGIRYLHTRKIPIFNKEGQAEYLLGVSEDITEKKETEKQSLALLHEQIAREEAEAYAHQMRFLSDVSYLLSESFDLEKIFDAFGHKVISAMADICVIDLLNEEGFDIAQTIVVSADNSEAEYIKAWRKRHPLRWNSNQGPAHIMRTGKGEFHNHMDLDDHLRNAYSADAVAEERVVPIVSRMIVPIKIRDQKPFGAVMFLYKTGEHVFTDTDLHVAEEICYRLAVAIENSKLYYRAQEASRSKSAFLANVSHEIRTPLGAMLGFAEIVREEENLSSNSREAIDIVLRNGAQLLRIVDEILDISKVESERIQIERIAFPLCQLLDDVIHLLEGRAMEKGVELISDCERLPEYIVTDPTRLRQILINIIGNAIKFTDQGSVTLKARAIPDQKEPKKGSIEFLILDTGIGISADQREQLFQAFVQADSSTTRRFGGTGLGLFLSRKLARLLGGDVILDKSLYGQGSSFVITIGYEEASADTQPRFALDKEEILDGYPHIQRVLIADDAADNRELFHHYLKKLGIPEERIDMAHNGRIALEKAASHAYGLILMDIQMPEMDGFQAVAELKKRNYPGMIVALTAHAMKGDEEKCLTAGFDGYLQKPLSREALRKILVRANSWKPSSSQSSASSQIDRKA